MIEQCFDALPAAPEGASWQGTTAGDTFNFQLVSDGGELIDRARIAVDMYGLAGVKERAYSMLKKA